MTRPAALIQAPETADSARSRHADTGIRAAAGMTVVALAGIAGAISYSHMRELAAAHGEAGWQAHTFPLSVDGIEIVASLVLLADRRTGRSSGWLPWAALVAGTTASLAANVAAAGTDLVGRIVAGWPAFALLIAVKLLSQLLEPRHNVDRPANEDRPVPGHDWPPLDRPAGDDLGAHDALGQPDNTDIRAARPAGVVAPAVTGNAHINGSGTGTAVTSSGATEHGDDDRGTIKAGRPGTRAITHMRTGTVPDITAMLPAAREARDRLMDRGAALTRDTLATQLRHDGHAIRNARISQLLTALKQESNDAPGRQEFSTGRADLGHLDECAIHDAEAQATQARPVNDPARR